MAVAQKIKIYKQEASEKVDPNQIYYLSCDSCVHLLSENKKLVAFPILDQERRCKHPRVAMLQEEGGVPARALTINDSIIDPESYQPSSSNTLKPKSVDDEMYTLIAAREQVKK